MIIFLLLIIIIILYFIKEINFINKLSNNKLSNNKLSNNKLSNNKLSNNKLSIDIFNYEIFPVKKISLLYLNPFLLKSYNDIFNEIKTYNKYDPNTYITFTELPLSNSDTNLLDWFGFTNGIIKYSIDTILKLIKKKQVISSKITQNLVYLNKYYEIVYGKKQINIYKKYINNDLNKKLESNIILQNLYKLYCYNKYILLDIIKLNNNSNNSNNNNSNNNNSNNLDKNQKKILQDIKKYVTDNKNQYKINLHLLNLHINNLHKKINKKSKSLFNKIIN